MGPVMTVIGFFLVVIVSAGLNGGQGWGIQDATKAGGIFRFRICATSMDLSNATLEPVNVLVFLACSTFFESKTMVSVVA